MTTSDTQLSIDKNLRMMDVITLGEMNSIRLMNRIDTKYVVSLFTLNAILNHIQDQYMVQEVDSTLRQGYSTIYFDTCNLDMYNTHHNGHRTREKIRVRTYVGSGTTFLEVKNKSNKGRTDKKRIEIGSVEQLNSGRVHAFLSQVARYNIDDVKPVISNRFRRITLVNRAMTERLTIDTDVMFYNLQTMNSVTLDGLAIIEVKRDGRAESPIMKILNSMKVRQSSFSKYCIGVAMTNSSVRQNRFKQKLKEINKFKQ